MVEAIGGFTEGRRVEYLIDSSGVGEIFRAIPGLMRKQATLLLYGHGHAGTDLSVLNNVQFLSRPSSLRSELPAALMMTGARALPPRASAFRGRHDSSAPFTPHRYTSFAAVPEASAPRIITRPII
ncbi:MAG: hypothetical protein WKF30_17670 [Pyrinomonadaceae bacterium]